MATADFPKRFSVGVTDKAHANLRRAAGELGVEQNMVITWLLEDLENVDCFRERAVEHREAKSGTSVRSLMRQLKDLSPEDRDRLLKGLQDGKEKGRKK